MCQSTFGTVKDRAIEGTILGNLGLVYERQGQWAEAEQACRQGLAIDREFNDRVGEGYSYTRLEPQGA